MLKERPKCRKVIESNGLRPQIQQGRWDGYQAARPDGTIVGLTSSMAKQMRKMLSEGRW